MDLSYFGAEYSDKKTILQLRKMPWRHDPRSQNFSHHTLFGTLAPSALPLTLGRPRRPVENQKNTLRCTGYGTAVNGGYIHLVRMHPDWQAAKIGQLQGVSVDIDGGDPNAAMRSERDCGYLPFILDTIHSLGSNTVENTGMNSFDSALDKVALDNRVAGFVSVYDPKAPQDIFDQIKSAIYMAYDAAAESGATVQAFGKYYYDWYPSSGVIPQAYDTTKYGYHHWLFVDFVWIHGVPYLVAHNSAGPELGDKGFFYFPREVVNREFGVWGTSLKIVKPLTQEQIDLGKQESPTGLLQRQIYAIWYAISEYIISLRQP